MTKTTDTETTDGIQVPLQLAEQTLRYLTDHDFLRKDLRIKRTTTHVYFPVKKPLPTIQRYKTIKKTFQRHHTTPTTYKKLLHTMPENLKQYLPTSYDIIGDIILIKLPEQLKKYKQEIGEALLTTNKHINVVCAIDPVEGELRTRTLEIIAGEQRTNTIHTEYGLHFHLDVQKTYFSPRLANERKHITTLVQPNETIVDMFTGVAPFAIMIARYAKPKIIYAIDKNTEAIQYATKNIKQNHLLDKIELTCTDAKHIPALLKKKNVTAHRIIMNLPFSAYQFFPQALQIAADTCSIHYYDILKEEQIPERLDSLRQQATEYNTKITDSKVRIIKTYAPREFYIGIDITAQKKAPM